MKIHKHVLAIILCFILALKGYSQKISFHNYTTDDGLSHNSVVATYQDERGFMWLGTRDGVNLYNGKEFKIYKHLKDNDNSLIYNEIKAITGDKKGTVFFMTNNQGISAYNIKQDKFTVITPQKTTAIYFEKMLYFANGNRLYKYQKSDTQLIYQLPSKDAIITQLYQTRDSILIGTSNEGLYLLKDKKHLSHIIPNGHIFNIFKASTGNLWISSYDGGGLYVLEKGSITNMRNDPNDLASISSNQVHCCCEDQNGDIWVGTFYGLNKYDKRTKQFTRYYKKQEKNSLSESSVWSLLCDHQGTVWAGTYYGGVNFFNPNEQIYHEYNVSFYETEGLSSPTIGRMIEDKHQNVWMCTEGGGICRYNLSSRTFKWYKHDANTNSISHDHSKSIYYDRTNDILWIGTHLGGLNKLDLKSNKFTQYTHKDGDSTTIPSNIVIDIVPLKEQLILGITKGIVLFDPKTGKCKPLFANKEYHARTSYCKDLIIDQQNRLWIVNLSDGVSVYNFKTQKLNHYLHDPQTANSLSSNNVNSIYKDSQNQLWFCTNEHGLDLYREETNDFENFDMRKNGLSSNVVYAVCELSKNRLLVTTDNGFSVFDCNQRIFTNYDKSKKIPLTSVNENSLYKASNGEIFIGGINGMISFWAKDLATAPRTYNLFPYQLFANGQKVSVGDETGILSEDLSSVKELTFSSKYSIFTLEYTSTDYLPLGKEEIIYQLEGFSDTWMKLSEQNNITYSNLSPGSYTLVVKTANSQNLNVPESRIQIHILPPFYRTVWAYLIYIVVAILLIYYLIRAYNNRIKLQESLKYEKKHAEDIENLNQAKLRFFTNISHEFRTPLTVIIGQMEMLLQSQTSGSGVYNSILKVYKGCLQLRELITELLDFRKQEQGYMTIKVSEHNIVNAIYEYYTLFQEYAVQKQISYKFIKSSDDIQVWYDDKQLRKVVNNLIINAFKHTPLKGKITVSVRKRNEDVIIEVTDNGKGIMPQDIDKVFNRFYQTESIDSPSHTGTGIGLALSKGIIDLHHGTIEVYSDPGIETTFSVHLKIGKEHFKVEQISNITQNELQDTTRNYISDSTSSQSLFTTAAEDVPNNLVDSKTERSKMLIVEDNEAVRGMLADLFNPFYKIIVACNGKEGIEKVNEEQPNIVVSDIVMPHVSGIELCKTIKENIDTCHIPIVLLTAKDAIEYNFEGLKVGADDYITKPFNTQLLLSRCNNLVNNRIMLQEKFCNQPQTTHRILANNAMDNDFIDRARKVILGHMDNVDFNVEVFAQEMKIARTKLFTKLKAISGQTPADFVLTIRLKEAAILLKNNPELNISEISDKVGFSSPKYFRKCFKDKYHITPQEYRKDEEEIEPLTDTE